jgi:integrase
MAVPTTQARAFTSISALKAVQTRLRHASVTTTLNTYGDLWPDADESARAAVGRVLAARADSVRTRRSS